MSSYYNQGVQVIVGNGQNFPGTPRISLIPFIQNAYDKGLLNFTVLPPGSISLAEIENISTSKILGRSTAGSGVIEQISIGTGLSLSGGTLSSTVTATPGGSDTQIQYNNAGVFGGSSQLIANIGATNTLDIQGSGSTSATNALRVRNSSGTNLFTIRNDGSTAIGTTPNNDLLYIYDSNVAGNKVNLRINNGNDLIRLGSAANSGHGLISTLYRLNIDGGTDGVNVLGKLNVGSNIGPVAGFTVSTNTTASTPSMLISGTGYSGGTATTTKPTLLIEPTGTTSTGWSTSGTKLGVNAESGFSGNLIDAQINGTSVFNLSPTGVIGIVTVNASAGVTALGGFNTTVGGNGYRFSSGGYFICSSNGVFKFSNSTDNDFGRLQFGGTTSSFPALKRNGTGLDIRLADDSAYAPVSALTHNSTDNGSSYKVSGNNVLDAGDGIRINNNPVYSKITLQTNSGTKGIRIENGNFSIGNLVAPLAGFHNDVATVASTPAILISGTGYSGGTSTTTKPTLLIEPTGTTSTGWSTLGTKLGVNAESGFTGALLDLQVNGVSKAYIASTGDLYISSRLNATSWRTSLSYEFYQPTTITSTTSAYYFGSSTIAGTNTDQKFWEITTTINKTGTGSYTLIDANVTETSVPSGVNYLMNLKTGGVSRFNVTNTGALNVTGGTSSGWASTFILGGGNAAHGVINGYANGTCQIYDKGTTGQQNIPNAVLNVSSTAKGFLPPRLTTAERDAVTWVAGDAGMMIFNTTLVKLQVWNGAAWETITSV